MPAPAGHVTFGPFEIDLDTGELRKAGASVKLQPQPATVLCLPVNAAGTLVAREDIPRRLWGESTFVDDDMGVDHCVNRIRAALGDSAQAPRYVETLPRRGYRFIAAVERQRAFDEAFRWLERASHLRMDLVWLTPGSPGIDPLRPDPRFHDIVRHRDVAPA